MTIDTDKVGNYTHYWAARDAVVEAFEQVEARLTAVEAGEGGTGFVSEQAGNTLTTNPLFWVGLQADYDLLTPDADTIYLILAES